MRSPASGVSPRTLRVMMVAAVGLLLAGAFVAISYGGDDDALTTLDGEDRAEDTVVETDEVAADVTVASTTVPSLDDAGDTAAVEPEAGDTEPTTSADAAPAENETAPTTTAPPAQATTAPREATSTRQLRPVPAGTYEYATDGSSSINGDEKKLPETTTLVAPAAGSDGRQSTTRDLRDGNGDGNVTKTSLRFAPEGVYLERIESTVFLNGGAFSQSTTLTPTATFLLVPADAGPGTKTSGQLKGDGITADVVFEVLNVGPETSVSRLVADLSGEVEGRQTSELTTRSSDLLTVKEISDSDIRSGPVRLQSNYTATLR